MRIGIFALAAGRRAGGPETYEVELIRALAALDRDNAYFVYCTSDDAADAIGVRQLNFAFRVLRPSWRPASVAVTLPRWMACDGLDFFHATYAPPPFPNRPFLFTMHCVSNFVHPEFYPAVKRWRLNALERVGLRRAGRILCVSDFVAGYLRAGFRLPAERLSRIYNGCGPEFHPIPPDRAGVQVRERLGIDSPYVLYVGKLQARKNVAGLVRAYTRYRERTGSNAKLVLAGKRVETSEGIEEAIEDSPVRNDILPLGHVPHPSADPASPLPSLYSAASMMVLPSFYEGFGIPVIEAMASGCPVLVSNAGSLPEIAGDAALVFDPLSVREMAARMAQLDGSPGLRSALIRRGLDRALLFTWSNCARQTLEAYRGFLAHQPCSSALPARD